MASVLWPAVWSWVLYSPYPRALKGIAYSDAAEDFALRDWGAQSSFSLHELVLLWGASSDSSSDGLGKTITYAVHPDFCTQLLPKFPEDGARSGNIDGFASFLRCDDLLRTIHQGFQTWAVNSQHISFSDVTAACTTDGAQVSADGTYRCSRAEVIIKPSDMANHPGAAGLFFPDLRSLDRAPQLTSGVSLTRGLGLRAAEIAVSTSICWYLDATFCFTLHALGSGGTTAFRVLFTIVLTISFLFVLYSMWRMLLAFLGYDLTNDDDKKPPPPKVKDAIKHSGKAITQGARAMTRRAATVGSRTAPLPQRPGGPRSPPLSPPRSPQSTSPAPSPIRSPPPSPPPARPSDGAAENDGEEDEASLYLISDVGLELKIGKVGEAGSSRTFEVVGPPKVKNLVESLVTGHALGTFSPIYPITLDPDARKEAGVPQEALHFAFAYPLTSLSVRPKQLRQLLQLAEKGQPWLYFLLFGGFAYLDRNDAVLQLNAVRAWRPATADPPALATQATTATAAPMARLDMVGPFAAPPRALAMAAEGAGLQEVTVREMKDAGFRRFGWLMPCEGGDAAVTAPGEAVEADGTEILPSSALERVGWPSGAFLYELEDKEMPAMLYVVSNNEEVRKELRALLRHDEGFLNEGLRAAKQAFAGAMHSLDDTWQAVGQAVDSAAHAAGEAAEAVLDSVGIDLKKADLSRFDREGTTVLGSARLANLIEYMSKMRIGWLVFSIFWMICTPTFYYRVFLPCYDCYDFKATMAHEVGHLLGFQHPDQLTALNLKAKAPMGPGVCLNPLAPSRVAFAPLPDEADSIMFSMTTARSRTCLTEDDVEGLSYLYPDCAPQQAIAPPVCYRQQSVGGWLRLGIAVLVPFALVIGLLLGVLALVRRFQGKRLAALEASVRKLKARQHWLSAVQEAKARAAKERGQRVRALELATLHAERNLAHRKLDSAVAEATKWEDAAYEQEAAVKQLADDLEAERQAKRELKSEAKELIAHAQREADALRAAAEREHATAEAARREVQGMLEKLEAEKKQVEELRRAKMAALTVAEQAEARADEERVQAVKAVLDAEQERARLEAIVKEEKQRAEASKAEVAAKLEAEHAAALAKEKTKGAAHLVINQTLRSMARRGSAALESFRKPATSTISSSLDVEAAAPRATASNADLTPLEA